MTRGVTRQFTAQLLVRSGCQQCGKRSLTMLGWLSQPTMHDVGIDAVDRATPATDAPLYRLSCITFNATTAGARRYAVHSKFTRRSLAWPTLLANCWPTAGQRPARQLACRFEGWGNLATKPVAAGRARGHRAFQRSIKQRQVNAVPYTGRHLAAFKQTKPSAGKRHV